MTDDPGVRCGVRCALGGDDEHAACCGYAESDVDALVSGSMNYTGREVPPGEQHRLACVMRMGKDGSHM